MANHFDGNGSDGHGVSISPEEARSALGAVAQDSARLADQIVTPWWYHPVLGVIVGVFVGAQALPGAWSVIMIALGIIAIPVLTVTYSRRYGVAISKPAGPRSRRLLLLALAVLLISMASSLAFKLVGLEQWWALVPATIACVATIILGRCYDDALRHELAAGTHT